MQTRVGDLANNRDCQVGFAVKVGHHAATGVVRAGTTGMGSLVISIPTPALRKWWGSAR